MSGYEKLLATASPEGYLRMDSIEFEYATCEDKDRIDSMKEGRKKYEASLHFADFCYDCSEYGTAYCYYLHVLQKTVSGEGIVGKYRDLAERAYQGVISCNTSNDEYVWEASSEDLAYYRQFFEEEEE